ncbi:hypothetical protein [Oleiharenicola lentus]|uniref:hypothetical protein n=1 Tax=Oleiharenicola lentus TaxID=2508720 RepID=UPI003F67C957
MSAISNQKTPYSLALAICLGLVVALGASGFDQYFKIPMLETGDIAVNALQVDHAKKFAELYGNYSRFEFNHPGPAFFYMYAAGEVLLFDWLHVVPAPGSAHLLTSMFLQCAFFSLALVLIATHLPWRSWLPFALLAAMLQFGALHDAFMSIWPPHVLLMPFLCLLASCVSVATGRIDHLPWAILTGGFLFHGHVAQPVFVGSLGGLAIVLGAWRVKQASPGTPWKQLLRANARWLWMSGGIIFVFLLPIAIDLLSGGKRSNIATIFGLFYANTGDSKSALQSFLYFWSYATTSRAQEDIFTVLGPQVGVFFKEHAVSVSLWASVLLLTPLLRFVAPRRVEVQERRFLMTAHLFLGAALIGSIVWGTAQAGPMTNFNSYFYYAIYFFGLLLLILWLDRLIQWKLNPGFTAALCAIAAIIATWSFRLPRLSFNETGMPIKNTLDSQLAQESARGPKLLVFEHADWPEVSSVALMLERRGIPYYMAPWWGFMFGARHQLAIADTNASPEKQLSVWWLARPSEEGIPLTSELSLYTKPREISPEDGEISFRGRDNAFRHVVVGVSAGNLDYAWTELPRLVLMLTPLPASRDVIISFDVQTAARDHRGALNQTGIVFFNGQEVARIAAGERADHPVLVPRDLWNSQPTATIEVKFPDATHNRSYRRPRHDSWSAWGLWTLRFGPG